MLSISKQKQDSYINQPWETFLEDHQILIPPQQHQTQWCFFAEKLEIMGKSLKQEKKEKHVTPSLPCRRMVQESVAQPPQSRGPIQFLSQRCVGIILITLFPHSSRQHNYTTSPEIIQHIKTTNPFTITVVYDNDLLRPFGFKQAAQLNLPILVQIG